MPDLRPWLARNRLGVRLHLQPFGDRIVSSYVELAVPSRLLARYVAHPDTTVIRRVERTGRLRRRYVITR